MATPLLSSASNLLCPHGGAVQLQQLDPRVLVSGAPVIRVGDAPVTGCTFVRPCVQVSFATGTLRAFASAQALLTAASTGQCLAADGSFNGPVQVAAPDARVSGS